MQYRICDFPQHKIAEALLPTSPNEYAASTCSQRRADDLAQEPVKLLRIHFSVAICTPCRPQDAVVRGIINDNAQAHARAPCGHSLTVFDGAYEACAQSITPADYVDADLLFHTPACLGDKKPAD